MSQPAIRDPFPAAREPWQRRPDLRFPPGSPNVGETAIEIRQSMHAELATVTDSLIAEHSGQVPAGTVVRCVAQAREQLLRAGVRAGLAIAVESMARTVLRGVGQPHSLAT